MYNHFRHFTKLIYKLFSNTFTLDLFLYNKETATFKTNITSKTVCKNFTIIKMVNELSAINSFTWKLEIYDNSEKSLILTAIHIMVSGNNIFSLMFEYKIFYQTFKYFLNYVNLFIIIGDKILQEIFISVYI